MHCIELLNYYEKLKKNFLQLVHYHCTVEICSSSTYILYICIYIVSCIYTVTVHRSNSSFLLPTRKQASSKFSRKFHILSKPQNNFNKVCALYKRGRGIYENAFVNPSYYLYMCTSLWLPLLSLLR